MDVRAQSVLPTLSEEAVAAWRRDQGYAVAVHRGRHWYAPARGFYQPVSRLDRFSADEATAPAPWLWGYRAPLLERDAAGAEGSLPVHLLRDLEAVTLEGLDRKQRNNVRKSQKTTQVAPGEAGLLKREGPGVTASFQKRTGYGKPKSPKEYARFVDLDLRPERQLVLAGLVDGKLGGYVCGYACAGTAYIVNIHVATEALPSCMGSGLLFEFLQACRRTPGVKEVEYGLAAPEAPSLEAFKASFGFQVLQVPARVRINPVAGALLRRVVPRKYYRLVGGAG